MRRVLITRLTAMGDVAMTAPIVAAACKANPDVQFDVLSTPFFQPFFEPLPNLRFIGTDIRKQKNGIIALWRLFQDLHHGRMPGAPSPDGSSYDVVLDLHDVLRTKVLRTLFRLTGAAVYSIDKGRAEKKRLISGKSWVQVPHGALRSRHGEPAAEGSRLIAAICIPWKNSGGHTSQKVCG